VQPHENTTVDESGRVGKVKVMAADDVGVGVAVAVGLTVGALVGGGVPPPPPPPQAARPATRTRASVATVEDGEFGLTGKV
jgi:hypothetical protein